MKSRWPLFVTMLGVWLTMPAQAQEIRSTFVRLGTGVPGVLYEPVTPGPKAGIGLLVMHPTEDYLRVCRMHRVVEARLSGVVRQQYDLQVGH